jgi:hypothetical protein
MRESLDSFLKDYWRDLMQSQPNHVEIVGEKLTLQSIIRPIASQYCIPYTLGRGFANLPVRRDIVGRWLQSGKDNLILLFLSDFDPDGEEIAHSFARSLRDDFGVWEHGIVPVKVALTDDQVIEYGLPPEMKAKESSPNYDRFAIEHGDDAFELEALRPEQLQNEMQRAIDQVIDTDAFNAELDEEKQDATFLAGVREQVKKALADVGVIETSLKTAKKSRKKRK